MLVCYPHSVFVSTLIKVVNNTKLEGAVSILEGKIAIQRDLGKSEKWADRNFVKFNKDKSNVLWLGWSNPLQQYKLRTNWLASSFAEKDLPVLVDSRLNVSQRCALAVLNANSMCCINRNIASGGDYSSLLSTRTMTGILDPVWGPWYKKDVD